MELLDLVNRCKGGEMSVFMAMLIAHAMGASTIKPSWLMLHTGQSDKTLHRNLQRLETWGLAQCLTTKLWRLSHEGATIELPLISENFRLGIVDNSVDNSTGYVIDAMSLRRKFSDLDTEVGNSPTSPTTTTTKSIRKNLLRLTEEEGARSRRISDLPNETIQQARRLADILRTAW